jgi:hypothetical protein
MTDALAAGRREAAEAARKLRRVIEFFMSTAKMLDGSLLVRTRSRCQENVSSYGFETFTAIGESLWSLVRCSEFRRSSDAAAACVFSARTYEEALTFGADASKPFLALLDFTSVLASDMRLIRVETARSAALLL